MEKTTLILISVVTVSVFILAIATANAEPNMTLPQIVPTAPTQPSVSVPSQSSTSTSTISGLAGSTVLSVSLANLDPNPAVAGDVVEVRIAIENKGGTMSNNLMVEIVPSYPFELAPGETAVHNAGIIDSYKTDSTANIKITTYKVKIDKAVSAGTYELKVKYYEQYHDNEVVIRTLNIDIKNRANVEVIHIDKAALDPGKLSDLKFTINNLGNAPLRDVTFKWENKDKVILPVGSDNTRYIKYIDINETYNLDYQVIADTNAKQGLYQLDLYLTYTDSINGTTKEISTIAGVYIGGGTDFDIALEEIAGDETSFNVANVGSNPAYAVLVTIPGQKDWKVSNSNSVMIGNLNSGDYTVASYKLQHISNSSQNMQMQISYTDTMGLRKTVDKEVYVSQDNTTTTTSSQISQPDIGFAFVAIAVLAGLIAAIAYRNKKKEEKNETQ